MRYLTPVLAVLALLPMTACTTAEKADSTEVRTLTMPPPKIDDQLPLELALKAGVDYGGDTLSAVKRLIKKRDQGVAAAALLRAMIHDNLQSYDHAQLINSGHLYAAMPVALQPEVFRELVGSGRVLAQQLGWQLAAVKPSEALAKAVDIELSRALAEGEDDSVMIPQMANAVRANHLGSAYTLMRVGLMAKGDEEFAQAMIHLDPQRASDDFLIYLAIPTAEELRQLSLSSINLYTSVVILRHLKAHPPTAGVTGFDHLFYFAVSRNLTLAEQAQSVLEQYIPQRTELLAQALAKMPGWVQIAYLESVRRHMSAKQGMLLSELQKTTAESDVVQEIKELKF